MKKSWSMLSITVFAICALLVIPSFAQETPVAPVPEMSYASGKVLEITGEKEDKELTDSFSRGQKIQTAKVLVLNGKYIGKTVQIENNLTSNPIYDINIKPGQRVVLNIEDSSQPPAFFVADIERYPVLMVVLGVFFGLMLLIGGKKGMNSIISIGITAALVFFALIPAILHNYPPIPSAIIVALVATFVTTSLVSGINTKSLAASLGTTLSVLLAGVISLLTLHFAALNGFYDQESTMLWMSNPGLDFTGILAASVIIGTLGIVMNVATSISGNIYDLKNINSNLTSLELIKSGINAGKDIMGMMANALILAYIGGSFSLILVAANSPITKLINLNSVATEIVAALTGSIGIILCVPITAVISGYFAGRNLSKSVQINEEKSKTEVLELK